MFQCFQGAVSRKPRPGFLPMNCYRHLSNSVYRCLCSAVACCLLFPLAVLAQPPHGVPEVVRSLPLERIRHLTGNTVDWAYAHYTAGRGVGAATAECSSPVRAGDMLVSCKVVVTAGAGGIAPGGGVSVMFPLGGTPPQTGRFWAPGYVMATTGLRWLPITLKPTWFFRQNKKFSGPNEIMVASVSLPDGLDEGDTLVFRRFRAHAGVMARGWGGERFRFRVYVDHDADGWEEEIADSPWLPKQPRSAHRLRVAAQSTAVVGEPVRLVVTAMDRYGNQATDYDGTVRFDHQGGSDGLPGAYTYTDGDAGARTFHARFDEPGFYWVTVQDEAGGLSAESNPVEVLPGPPRYRLYWGDLHAHTEMSADAWNFAPSVSTYDGSYNIGRFRYGLDFMANTDHHDFVQGNYAYEDWQQMVAMSNAANSPGEFVALVAAEVSHAEGDQNIYVPGDSLPYLGRRALAPRKLWALIEPYEALAVPHHFAQSMRPWNWNNFEPARMRLAEIFSAHGRAEFHGNEPHYSTHAQPTLPGQTWQDQLARGRKLGAIAASDDHAAAPGSLGLAGVWADSLTRRSIYQGLKDRRTYASTNARVILHFSVNGEVMGSTVGTSQAPLLRVRGATPTEILEVHVLRNNELVYQGRAGGRTFDVTWEDKGFSGDAYYYVRIKVANGDNSPEVFRGEPEYVWSSPVWVTDARLASAGDGAGRP